MSGIVQKAKEAVDKVVHPEHHNTGTGSTNAGPHDSNMANKADPRVDSDRDGSRNAGAATGTTGYGNQEYSSSGTTGGMTGSQGYGSSNAGPHSSNMANTADPRVDSDLDGSRTVGGNQSYGNQGGYSGSGTTGGLTGSHAHGSSNAGPHSSNMANAADPRIDSDLDGSRTVGGNQGYGNQGGYSGTTGGMTGSHAHGSSNAGPHSSNMANQADPRVDSDLDGSRTVGSNQGYSGGSATSGMTGQHGQSGLTGSSGHSGLTSVAGTGPAANTAGPHKSDMMNKADPRVDSDLDGSKTMGGNKTYTDSGVPDASEHTPTEFRKRLEEDNHPAQSDHQKRHSLADLGTKGTFDKYGSGHQ